MSFEGLNLSRPILQAVKKCGYKRPTPIQKEAIPLAMSGRDVIASAQTGTGKTAAFVLPILHKLSGERTGSKKGPRALVLSPTRELAQQVVSETRRYGSFLKLKYALILGGMSYRPQLKALASGTDLVVGTPGRLLDHIKRGSLDLSGIEVLVLDEADRMLDMGFKRDVERITRACASSKQTLLFTATLDRGTTTLAKTLMKKPKSVNVVGGGVTVESITQHIYLADSNRHKKALLDSMVKDKKCTKAVIFSATKRGAEKLAKDLRKQGYRAAALHGDMSQAARSRTMSNMRKGKVNLLVATDVAARGLDVTGISHVINFDLPQAAHDYVHRIGRTGRAGAKGIAISLACGSKDAAQLHAIERFIGKRISRKTVKGLEPKAPLPKPLSTTRSFKPRKNRKRFSFGLKRKTI